MNKVHRIIWSSVRQCFVVACELAHSLGKGSQTGSLSTASGTRRGVAGNHVPRMQALAQAMLLGGLIGTAAAQSPVGTVPATNQLPTGGKLVAGQAAISQSGANMVINQNSQRAAIDWNTFNVGSGASVQFVQPSSSSVILNRVLDANPSQIFGRISANGQVFLTNPNGLYFSPSASVDVGGLVATTHQIALSDFMAGKATFERMGATGSVLNEGQLKASLGGYIALLAPEVRNQGLIVAQLGTVALAAGEAFDLQFDSNNSLASVHVTPSTIAALVDNRTAVLAPGGLIILTALGVRQLQSGVVNNAGNLEASSLVSQGGRILLQGDKITLEATSNINASGATGGGAILVGGDWQGSGDMSQALSLQMDDGASIHADATQQGNGGKVVLWSDVGNDASHTTVAGSISARGEGAGGNGGQVETSGHQLTVADTARMDTAAALGLTGSWLLDPIDFTIASGKTGTVTAGTPSGDISGATLSTALGTSNVTIGSGLGSTVSGSGDINVNDAVSWTQNTLTLTAAHNININAVMSAGAVDNTGTAGTFAILTMNPSTTNNGDTAVGGGMVLVGMTGTGFGGRVDFFKADGATPRGGAGFLNISGTAYTVINSLGAQGSTTALDLQGMNGGLTTSYALGSSIDGSASSGWTNKFASIGGGFTGNFNGLGHTINNLTVNGQGLFSRQAYTLFSNVGLVSGSVTGTTANVGSLVGFSYGNVANAYNAGMTVTAAGQSVVGGLIGTAGGTVSNSFSTGAVTGGSYVGGLIGFLGGGIVSSSYETGAVTLTGNMGGGLVGYGSGPVIVNCYALGSVTGGSLVGGLLGYASYGMSIANSYATGKVTGAVPGGLVSAYDNNGPFTIAGSFYDATVNPGSPGYPGVTGMTTANMKTLANFTSATVANGNANPAWDFTSSVWSINPAINNGYPYLTAAPPCANCAIAVTALTISLANTSKTYGAVNPTLPTYNITGLLSGDSVTALNWGSAATQYLNVGTYAYSLTNFITPTFTYGSGHSAANYTITWSNNGLSITPQTVTLAANKTYDGTTSLTGQVTLGGLVNGQTLSYVGATSSDAHVATAGKYVSAISLTDGTGLASNYALPTLNAANAPVNITAALLTSVASIGGTLSKTYDGSTSASGATLAGSVSGAIAGDTLSLNTSGESLAYNSAHVASATQIAATGSAGFTIGATSNSSVASDYSFTGPTIAAASASITAKALTSSASIGGTLSKTYDGSTSASGATVSGSVSGAIAGDTLSLDTSGESLAYNNAHVVSATQIAATGSSNFAIGSTTNSSVASDYSFTGPSIAAAAASITTKALTSSASIVGTLSRVYDGSTSASGAAVTGIVSGAIAGDTLSLDTSGESLAYNNAHVASATQVAATGSSNFTIGSTSSSSVASDYSFTGPTIAAATASITAKALVSSASIGGTLSKVYDGNTSAAGATVSGSVSGAIAGDTLSIDTSGESLAYNNAHVASATQILATGTSGFTIGSTTNSSVASDYSFTGPTIAAATASITTKALTSSASIGGTLSKTYDGSTSASGATVSGIVSGAIPGDTLTLNTSGESLAYNNAHVATATQVAATGTSSFTIGSTTNSSVASDYSFTGPTIASATASISAKAVTLSANKVYDGTASLVGAVSVGTGVGSETLGYSGALASDAHVLTTGKFINAITLADGTGPNAGLASDYQLPGLSSVTAPVVITPAALGVSMTNTGVTKTYDGTTNAPLGLTPGYSVTGLVSGDSAASLSTGSVLYDNANVASATTLNAAGLVLGSITGNKSSATGDYECGHES
jgi:filamentous hemagglutinin family protein